MADGGWRIGRRYVRRDRGIIRGEHFDAFSGESTAEKTMTALIA